MFFTERFNNLSDQDREEFYKSVFMNMEGDHAAEARNSYYKDKFKSMGEGVYIGRGVKIVNPQFISLGDNVIISDGCTLIATNEAGISLADGVTLKDRVYLDTETPEGYIKMGKAVYIGTGTAIHGHQGVEIGDHSLLAQNITITPYSHKFDDCEDTIINQGGHTRKVTIGRDCYIGMGCCVVYSADVGDGSVVGSGSVVVHTIPPYSVAVGVPAKVIRKRGDK